MDTVIPPPLPLRRRVPHWRRWLAGAALLLAPLPALLAAELVVLVDTGTEMPMAGFGGGQLVDGVHKDLGQALAQKMDRRVQFLLLPRKRIALALESGKADMLCLYVPDWLPGNFGWSQAFFPLKEVVVTDKSVAQPLTLADLRGQRIATVLGYYHPELQQLLGDGFLRDDGPSSTSNLRKMAAGRMHHAVTQQSTLDYLQKTGVQLAVYPPLEVKNYLAQCAVSPQGQVDVREVNKAISQLLKEGVVAHILARYK